MAARVDDPRPPDTAEPSREPWELPGGVAAPSPPRGLPRAMAPAPPVLAPEAWELPGHTRSEPPDEPGDVQSAPPRRGLRAAALPLYRHAPAWPGRRPTSVAAVLVLALIVLGGLAVAGRPLADGGGLTTGPDAAQTAGLSRPGATPAAGTAGGNTPAPAPSTPHVVASSARSLVGLVRTIRAPASAPAALDAAGDRVSYGPRNLVDGDPGTTWRMRGDAKGRTITVTFSRPVTITRVGLVNGYVKVDPASGTDRYRQNRRVLRVRWSTGAGPAVVQRLRDGDRSAQTVAISARPTRTLRLTVLATARGTKGFDYTAISEVVIEGR